MPPINLLALLNEKISKKSYGEFLNEELLSPLGMTQTAHRDASSRPVRTNTPALLSARFHDGERMLKLGAGKLTKKTLEQTGETLGFGLKFSSNHEQSLAELVESEGLTVGETFFMGTTSDQGPYVVIAELEV